MITFFINNLMVKFHLSKNFGDLLKWLLGYYMQATARPREKL